jgi:hypothetical protein
MMNMGRAETRKSIMRKMAMSSVLALVMACTLGVGIASAELSMTLLIENKTTQDVGTDISAAPGDLVKFSLEVRNLSRDKVDTEVTVIGGIPGCMIEEMVVTNFASNQKRKENVVGKVPLGHAGQTLTVEVNAVASDGSVATAQGSVNLVAKATSGSSDPSAFERTFLRMLAKGLLLSMDDEGPAETTMSGLKAIYR